MWRGIKSIINIQNKTNKSNIQMWRGIKSTINTQNKTNKSNI